MSWDTLLIKRKYRDDTEFLGLDCWAHFFIKIYGCLLPRFHFNVISCFFSSSVRSLLFVAILNSSWITGVVVVTITWRFAFSSDKSDISFSRRSWNSSSVDFSSSEQVLFSVWVSNQSESARATWFTKLCKSERNSVSSFNWESINQLWNKEMNSFSRSGWYFGSDWKS